MSLNVGMSREECDGGKMDHRDSCNAYAYQQHLSGMCVRAWHSMRVQVRCTALTQMEEGVACHGYFTNRLIAGPSL